MICRRRVVGDRHAHRVLDLAADGHLPAEAQRDEVIHERLDDRADVDRPQLYPQRAARDRRDRAGSTAASCISTFWSIAAYGGGTLPTDEPRRHVDQPESRGAVVEDREILRSSRSSPRSPLRLRGRTLDAAPPR